jgi:poly(A) polymerase
MLEIILALARSFRAQGYELYMVGGTVRDLVLHRDTPPDVDLATNARPDDIKRLVAPTHPVAVITVGEQFGTVRLHYRRPEGEDVRQPGGPAPAPVVASAEPDVDVIEITTYRSDRYDPTSRKPEVTFGDTLEGDLLRRDFTMNAMARDPQTGEIIDPYGGRADLEAKLIRAVGNDPARRFDEDPLRMLRAARFAAQFHFRLEDATARAIERQAATLQKISHERIRDEFTKLLVTPHPALGLRLLVDLGLMPYIVPEVLHLRGVSQAPAHSKDVYEHVLRVVERTPARAAVRWAGLLHDIAKPRTRSVEDGKVHFFGHEDVGAGMTRDILKRLKFDRAFIDHVSRLVRMHMRANAYTRDWTDGAVRRLMLEAGDTLNDLLDLSRADITSYRPEKVSRAVARINELEARCRWLREEAERVPLKSPLDGNDLMELFGRGPGPWLRPVKDYLLGLVIDGRLAPDDRATAEREARAFLALQPVEGAPTDRDDGERNGTVPGVAPPPAEGQEMRRATRAATRRRSTAGAPSAPAPAPTRVRSVTSRAASRGRDSNPTAPAPGASPGVTRAGTAARDEITRFLDAYLEIERFRDVAPNGLQVVGKPEVRHVAIGVSANLALFREAARQGADLIVVHHGILLEREPRPILARMKARLQLLFEHDMTLLGYHLPLDAHPVVGNNVQWLRRLQFAPTNELFGVYQGATIGAIGVREQPLPFVELVRRVAALAGQEPRVYHFGPDHVRRLAVNTGAAPGSLSEAIALGCDAYLTGEVAEGTQAVAIEEGGNFLAAGHYNTEKFGVQALGDLLREHFGVEVSFIDVPNDV